MRTLATLALLLAMLPGLSQAAGDKKPPRHVRHHEFPSFATIEKIVHEHFQKKRYDATTLLSRGDVAPLFSQFEKAGWKVEDQKQILDQVLPDNDYMVQELRTPDGRRFAAEIARYPDGYDRTDRMRRLDRGDIFLHDLIENPGGYKMIEYMTTSPYGYNMGEMLSEIPAGRNFNAPTTRLYTTDRLLKRLHESYARAEAERKAAKTRHGN